jgi:hypothetical protein
MAIIGAAAELGIRAIFRADSGIPVQSSTGSIPVIPLGSLGEAAGALPMSSDRFQLACEQIRRKRPAQDLFELRRNAIAICVS